MKKTTGILLLAATAWGCSSGKTSSKENPLVKNLTLTQVAAYQTLKTTLMKDGTVPDPEVPIVVGKAMTLRAFVAPGDGWDNRQVTVRFTLASNGQTNNVDVPATFYGASLDSDLTSTANLDLTGDQVTADLAISVSLRETQKGHSVDNPGAIFPPDGSQLGVGAQDTGADLQIVVVPIKYGADGSNRLPDMSDALLNQLRDKMLALYPTQKVTLTIGDTMSWKGDIAADGTGWGELLYSLLNKRYQDGAADNVYYYGLFAPAQSFDNFCGYGCVLGLSAGDRNKNDATTRGSIGLGYPGSYAESDITFVHEIGHAHGRDHAPCGGPDGIDRKFPYSNGGIGVWGYDVVGKKLMDPEGKVRDMMGYCSPDWISDYTYKALFDRVKYVNSVVAGQALQKKAAWRAAIIENGRAKWAEQNIEAVEGATDQVIERITAGGTDTIKGRFYPFDHIDGGILFVPAEEASLGTLRWNGLPIK